jgi:hypothetical protein
MDIIEKAKETWISASKFAELIGASRQAVSKAILAGRIWRSVRCRNCSEKKRYFINVYYGLVEWRRNTDPGRPDTKRISLYEILSSRPEN